MAAAGRGEAGSFPRRAARRQPRLEAVRSGTPAPAPLPAQPHVLHCPSGRPGGPRSHRVGVRDGETRAHGYPALSSLPARSLGWRKGSETKGRWGGSLPHTPSQPAPSPSPPLPPLPRAPARSLLVVAEDLVGDFTVENFLVGPQVRGRLLSHKRLSV